jgi:hypothetical protein
LTAQLASTSSRLTDLQGTESSIAASVLEVGASNSSLGKKADAQAARVAVLKKRAASLRVQIAAVGG